ncbi:hypothetical protein Clacol_000035 [Clathrus columnatus]|uniref:Uncharacterized protein n=1 Tax=Clathrus columnatus TaxID=1419009 RepID=A0AAV4ZZN3_9AGAM|nr:hypothetical protein Clacol_000035 [Clathrus columnatus]
MQVTIPVDISSPSTDAMSLLPGCKRAPIYLFYEEVPTNAQGLPGKPGDKHYCCYHGNWKVLTVTKDMKYNQNVLSQCSSPATLFEAQISSNKIPYDSTEVTEHLNMLREELGPLKEAFSQQLNKPEIDCL